MKKLDDEQKIEEQITDADVNDADAGIDCTGELQTEKTDCSNGDSRTECETSETSEEQSEINSLLKEFARVNVELEQQKKLATEMTQAAQRLQADFDNFRKRNVDSVKVARTSGENDVLSGMIAALDGFDAALKMIPDEGTRTGILMIKRQFLDCFAGFGVEQIQSLNCEFDPSIHDAIEQSERENCQSGVIFDVLQQGYKRGDKVLRAALVRVAK